MTEILNVAKGYAEDIEEAYENGELIEYIDEHALDIEYTISGNMDYLGVSIAVALGGPSVYINTREKCVEAYWGGESATYTLDSDVVEELDYFYEDYYLSMR